MTVAELVAELSKYPGHKDVRIRVFDDIEQSWDDEAIPDEIDSVEYVGNYVRLDPRK